MKTVNYSLPYTHRVTLRLNEEQYEYLLAISKLLDVSPSDYIRMTINATMVNARGVVGTHEDVKADSND